MRKPEHEQTYANLKIHFMEAHTELRATDTTVNELGYHSANALVEQIADRLNHLPIEDPPPFLPPVEEAHAPPAPPPPSIANATQQTPDALLMQQMIAQMNRMEERDVARQAELTVLRNAVGQGRGRNQNDHGGRGRGRGRGRAAPLPRRRGSYCWTHGNCANTGSECLTPSDGHIATATFTNMQGGSTLNCE